MFPRLKTAVNDWYANSPKRAVAIKVLHENFKKDTNMDISYNYFLEQIKIVSKVRSIKIGGFYVKFSDFIDMTITRSLNNINSHNTISIDEKPFIPKKFNKKSVRVHNLFKGRSTAQIFNCPNPFINLKPHYLLCAISIQKVVLFCIKDHPYTSKLFNAFLWKLSEEFPNNNEKLFFLFDNASFHSVEDVTKEKLNSNKIFITNTAPLGCFTDPIEEFFSIVDSQFRKLLSKRISSFDRALTNEEFVNLIKNSVRFASVHCNYKLIYARAGLM